MRKKFLKLLLMALSKILIQFFVFDYFSFSFNIIKGLHPRYIKFCHKIGYNNAIDCNALKQSCFLQVLDLFLLTGVAY